MSNVWIGDSFQSLDASCRWWAESHLKVKYELSFIRSSRRYPKFLLQVFCRSYLMRVFLSLLPKGIQKSILQNVTLRSLTGSISSFFCNSGKKFENGNLYLPLSFLLWNFSVICSVNLSHFQVVLNLMSLMRIKWGIFQIEDAKWALWFSVEFGPHNSNLSCSHPPFWPLRSPAICPSLSSLLSSTL